MIYSLELSGIERGNLCRRPIFRHRRKPLSSEFGGARRDRTADLLHAMQALSQLSYSPKLWRPLGDYETPGVSPFGPAFRLF